MDRLNGEYDEKFGKIFEKLENQEMILQEIKERLKAIDTLQERVLRLELWTTHHDKMHKLDNKNIIIDKQTGLAILSILAAGGFFGYILSLMLGR